MSYRLLIAAVIWLLSATTMALAQSQFESSKMSPGVVLKGAGDASSKLSPGIVLQGAAHESSKLSPGIVLQNTALQASKISVGIVLETAMGRAIVPRAPLTHW